MWMLIREADGKESRLIVLCGSENILDWMKPVLPSAAQWDMGHLNKFKKSHSHPVLCTALEYHHYLVCVRERPSVFGAVGCTSLIPLSYYFRAFSDAAEA